MYCTYTFILRCWYSYVHISGGVVHSCVWRLVAYSYRYQVQWISPYIRISGTRVVYQVPWYVHVRVLEYVPEYSIVSQAPQSRSNAGRVFGVLADTAMHLFATSRVGAPNGVLGTKMLARPIAPRTPRPSTPAAAHLRHAAACRAAP